MGFLCTLSCILLTLHLPWFAVVGAKASTAFGLAQLLAFPLLGGLMFFMLAGGALSFAWWKRRMSVPWKPVLGVALLSLLNAGFFLSLLADEVQSDGIGAAAADDMVIFEWNTLNSPVPQEFAEIVNRYDPDVMVFPELGNHNLGETSYLAQKLMESGTDAGNYEIFTSRSYGLTAPVSVFVKRSLGGFEVADSNLGSLGGLILRPNDAILPVIVAVHTSPPLPGLMGQWRDDLLQIVTFLEDNAGEKVILAGDLNAQRYHGVLNNLSGYVDSNPGYLGGTWPRAFPRVLRAHIDHILVSESCDIRGSEYYEPNFSDHSALVATVAC